MTIDEVYKIIYVIRVTYPRSYERLSERDFERMAEAWNMCFEDYTYSQISLGLKAYMTSNASGFPPVPAQIIEMVNKANPIKEMNSNEAWALVYKAIGRSTYYAEEEYDKLPPLVQKAVGTPVNLREMAAMDINTVNSVEGSHFKRNYEALLKREREYAKIPASTRQQLEAVNGALMIEGE